MKAKVEEYRDIYYALSAVEAKLLGALKGETTYFTLKAHNHIAAAQAALAHHLETFEAAKKEPE